MSIEEFDEYIIKESNRYQTSIDENTKKEGGIYYTDLKLAEYMVKKLFDQIKIKEIWELSILEPCVGIGIFIYVILKYIYQNYKLSKKQMLNFISNIYVCDADSEAIEIYKKIIKRFLKEYYLIDLKKENINLNIGGALIYDLNDKGVRYIGIEEYFSRTKFDIVITNPPYKNLRIERKSCKTIEEFEKIKKNIKKNMMP